VLQTAPLASWRFKSAVARHAPPGFDEPNSVR
jgi:hypothetical protein